MDIIQFNNFASAPLPAQPGFSRLAPAQPAVLSGYQQPAGSFGVGMVEMGTLGGNWPYMMSMMMYLMGNFVNNIFPAWSIPTALPDTNDVVESDRLIAPVRGSFSGRRRRRSVYSTLA
jgi:hypothetical protein